MMPQQRNAQKRYSEGTLELALSAIAQDEIKGRRRAAAIYDVPESTLRA